MRRAKRPYRPHWTPQQALQASQYDPVLDHLSSDVLAQVAQWLQTVSEEKRTLAETSATDPRRETVFPATLSTHLTIEAHVRMLPADVSTWFDPEALAQMKPRAQNAWFYSFHKLYTDGFRAWVERAETLLRASEARVYYSTPVVQCNAHRKRGRTIQAVTLTGSQGKRLDGVVEMAKHPDKCVKCNGSRRSLYFKTCGCVRHYADRCLRCKILQWALEGAFRQRLRGRQLMPDPLCEVDAFQGQGRCLEGCGQTYPLAHLTRVMLVSHLSSSEK